MLIISLYIHVKFIDRCSKKKEIKCASQGMMFQYHGSLGGTANHVTTVAYQGMHDESPMDLSRWKICSGTYVRNTYVYRHMHTLDV